MVQGSRPGASHRPPLQKSRAAHTLPQAPQLAGSLRTLTQTPPQSIDSGTQMHSPPTQACPPTQAFPHAPQLAGSISGSTQTPPQFVVPAGHTMGVGVGGTGVGVGG